MNKPYWELDDFISELLKQLPIYVFWKNKEGVFLGCNDLFAHSMGFSGVSEVIGKTDCDLPITKQESDAFRADDQQIINSNCPKLNKEETQTFPDGRQVILLTSKVPLHNKEGEVIGVLGIYNDITERKKMEKALNLAKKQTESANMTISKLYSNMEGFVSELLKQLPTYVFWKDKKGVYLGCNELFARSLGLEKVSDIVGKTDYDLPTTKEESDAFRADDQHVINSNCPKLNKEETQTFPDGRQVTLLTSKAPLRNKEGEVIGILGIYSDITERKKMEQELQLAKEQAEASNKAKSAFVANISHDIRVPLTGVIGISEMMLADEKHRTVENIAMVKQSGEKLLSMMNKILDFVKTESPDFRTFEKEESFSIASLLHDTTSLYAPVIKKKNLELRIEVDHHVPELLLSKPGCIYKVINNLVGNAIKFTDKGEIVITAEYTTKETKPYLILKVKDTGIGVPEDKREVIFGWFERLTPAYQGVYQGTGLGLAIVKQSMDSLHGTIEVTDNNPQGTVFICTIPVSIPEQTQSCENKSWLDQAAVHEAGLLLKSVSENEPSSDPEPNTQVNESKNLLLVEDQMVAAYAARNVFENFGYNVVWVKTGEDGVREALNGSYELMVCDIGLPGINGLEVAKQCRTNGIAFPIYALTGHADLSKEEFTAAGFDAVFIKPITNEIFKQYLAEQQPKQSNNTQEKLVDVTLAMRTNQFTESFALDLLSMYSETLSQEMIALKEAAKINDRKEIRSILHRLRGGATYCGVTKLSNVMEKVHEEVKQNHNKDIHEILAPLYPVAELTLVEINKGQKANKQ